jgi:hypothetical protein
MERARWTDDRLDGQMAVIDARFEHAFDELRAMREEMRAEFAAVRGEIAGLRGDVAEVRGDLSAFQRQVTHILAGLAVALLGVVAAGVAAAIAATQ